MLITLTVTVICLIMQQRYGKKYNDYQSLRVDDDSDHPSSLITTSTPAVLDIEDFGNVLRRNGRRGCLLVQNVFLLYNVSSYRNGS